MDVHHLVAEFREGENIKRKAEELFNKLKSNGEDVRINAKLLNNPHHQVIEIKNKKTGKWEILTEFTHKGVKSL